MSHSNSVLFLTPGDSDGIGPEVTTKAIQSDEIQKLLDRGLKIKIFGDTQSFEGSWTQHSGLEWINHFAPNLSVSEVSFNALLSAVAALNRSQTTGNQCGLVTGPICKIGWKTAGVAQTGHTEVLAHLSKEYFGLTSTPKPIMVLENDSLKVALATIHLPLKCVPEAIRFDELVNTLLILDSELRRVYKIENPKIGVLGLNPHGGEDGLLGNEEVQIISPAISKANSILGLKAPTILGPFPADGYFGSKQFERFDITLALYHDQGLIPVKLIDFYHTINITLGLPFLRTSVDHGTAKNIYGQNKANPYSMIRAIRVAYEALENVHPKTTGEFR